MRLILVTRRSLAQGGARWIRCQTTAWKMMALIFLLDLRPYVPFHPAHIYKLIRRGEFPKPVRLGRRTAFRRRDIREWVTRAKSRYGRFRCALYGLSRGSS